MAEVDPRGFRTTGTFDAAGNRTTLKDAVGNVTTWAYDSLNRVTTETDPLGNSATFAYDAAGRKASETDRLGRRRDFAFDAAGRVETEKWYAVGGALSQTQTFTYDAADRMLTAQDPDGTYTLAYDNAGRVGSVQEPFSLVLTMAHDAAGNRTLVQDSKGGVTTVTFDALDRQSSERVGGSGVSAARFDYGYTARSEVASVTRYSDLAGTAVVGTTAHDYDAAGRQTHLKHTSGAGSTLAEYTYTYDAADRLTEKVESGASTTYAYDSADQLTVDGASGFSYDGTGNRTNAGYATGAGNRLSTDGVRTYTHDANGNVTQSTVGGAGATWVYSYDHRNQLVSAAYSATLGGTVTQLVTYSYDAFGVRIERQYWDGSTTTTERYGVDGWDRAKPGAVGNESYDTWVELDGTGAVVTRYAWGTGFHELVALQDGGGAVEWALTDHQKSVRKVIDNSASVVGTTDYTAFGAPAGPVALVIGFTGYTWDPATQLWMSPGRPYDPWTGRFTSADALGFAAGDPNLFRYVGNSPTNATDPSGHYLIVNDPEIAWYLAPIVEEWTGLTLGKPQLLGNNQYIIREFDKPEDMEKVHKALARNALSNAPADEKERIHQLFAALTLDNQPEPPQVVVEYVPPGGMAKDIDLWWLPRDPSDPRRAHLDRVVYAWTRQQSRSLLADEDRGRVWREGKPPLRLPPGASGEIKPLPPDYWSRPPESPGVVRAPTERQFLQQPYVPLVPGEEWPVVRKGRQVGNTLVLPLDAGRRVIWVGAEPYNPHWRDYEAGRLRPNPDLPGEAGLTPDQLLRRRIADDCAVTGLTGLQVGGGLYAGYGLPVRGGFGTTAGRLGQGGVFRYGPAGIELPAGRYGSSAPKYVIPQYEYARPSLIPDWRAQFELKIPKPDRLIINNPEPVPILPPEAFVRRVDSSMVYRVQGGTFPKISWERIVQLEDGTIKVIPEAGKTHQTNLYITFDDLQRMRVYLRDNRPGGKIVSVEVDPNFFREVRAAAESQAKKPSERGLPEIADPTKTTSDVRKRLGLLPHESSAYGLPPEWIEKFEKAMIPGTFKIVE